MAFQHRINLIEDWEKIVCDYLRNEDHKIPRYNDKLGLGVFFCNLKYMDITAKKRTVFFSKEFTCPPVFKKRVVEIQKRIEKGLSIKPFLSKGSSRIKNKDYLLYDWNIYHLHLGKLDMKNSKFSSRTNELLFIYVTEESIYFIDILNHESFTEKKLLSIIRSNWPFLLDEFLIEGVLELSPMLSEDDIGLFRKKGISMFTQLDSGEIFFPPGRGIVSTSDSAKSVHSTLSVLNHLRKSQESVVKNIESIKLTISNYSNKEIDNMNLIFQLKIINTNFYLVEINSNYVEYLFSHDDYSLIK